MLLRDPDVEDPGRELGGERRQAHRLEHRCGDRDQVGPPPPEPHHLVGEHRGPAEPRRRDRQARLRVDHAHRVEPVGDVLLGGAVAAALLGDHVDDHRAAERLRALQRALDGAHVVPVDRADVLQAEVLEHALRRDDVLDALLQPVQRLVREPSGRAGPVERALAPGQHVLVAAGGAQRGQVRRQAPDRRRVGALVVVDHDDQAPVAARGDVVQRLPGHPAGQRAVTDHHRDVPVRSAAQLVRLGDAVRPGQPGRRVGVLDHVVLGLAAARVAGQPAALAQVAEVRPAGEQLVDVGLVAGVEHDRVARGLEHPVQRDGQLDDPEVGAQVPAGARHRSDQELPDLGREVLELTGAQCPDVGRRGDPGQQSHPVIVRARPSGPRDTGGVVPATCTAPTLNACASCPGTPRPPT